MHGFRPSDCREKENPMPIYEYCCDQCAHEFEQIMRMSDADPMCPSCGAKKTRKLISAGAIRPEGIPKGSGGFSAPGCGGSGCKIG